MLNILYDIIIPEYSIMWQVTNIWLWYHTKIFNFDRRLVLKLALQHQAEL